MRLLPWTKSEGCLSGLVESRFNAIPLTPDLAQEPGTSCTKSLSFILHAKSSEIFRSLLPLGNIVCPIKTINHRVNLLLRIEDGTTEVEDRREYVFPRSVSLSTTPALCSAFAQLAFKKSQLLEPPFEILVVCPSECRALSTGTHSFFKNRAIARIELDISDYDLFFGKLDYQSAEGLERLLSGLPGHFCRLFAHLGKLDPDRTNRDDGCPQCHRRSKESLVPVKPKFEAPNAASPTSASNRLHGEPTPRDRATVPEPDCQPETYWHQHADCTPNPPGNASRLLSDLLHIVLLLSSRLACGRLY